MPALPITASQALSELAATTENNTATVPACPPRPFNDTVWGVCQVVGMKVSKAGATAKRAASPLLTFSTTFEAGARLSRTLR